MQAVRRKEYDRPERRVRAGIISVRVLAMLVSASSTTRLLGSRSSTTAHWYLKPWALAHSAPPSSAAGAPTRRISSERAAEGPERGEAMASSTLQVSHWNPSPREPSGQAPQVTAPPVKSLCAATSEHCTPGAHGLAAHPSISEHKVSPLPEYPGKAGHGPHSEGTVPLPGRHLERAWQPPLPTSQEVTSRQPPKVASPTPRIPAGQAPHSRPLRVSVQLTRGSHPPSVNSRHSLIGLQVKPSPRVPRGHSPQPNPTAGAGRSKHLTPEAHGDWAHGDMKLQVTPSPTYPVGQAPQVKPSAGGLGRWNSLEGTSVHSTVTKHGLLAHPSISSQCVPFPDMPAGQSPQRKPTAGGLRLVQGTPE
mmetsp:Transcript_31281/g.99789  ORF Transcript_31281/g.99789 Transcript_31281/m.99789 type:complete len:363 (+) Transcript_31281:1359-2447(+)